MDLNNSYSPKIDDYVRWKNDEGWVYFICPDYLTIEVRVKDKCQQNIKDCPLHKKTHVLVVCYSFQWNELEYIKNRRDPVRGATYKSQEYRYAGAQ